MMDVYDGDSLILLGVVRVPLAVSHYVVLNFLGGNLAKKFEHQLELDV